MASVTFTKKKTLFYQQIGLKYKEGNSDMLYLGIALYGAEGASAVRYKML